MQKDITTMIMASSSSSLFSSSSSLLQRRHFVFTNIICLQLIIIMIYINAPTTTMAQQLFPHAVCSTTSGNFTKNSTYQTTLTSLFSSINSSLSYGFFNASSLTTDDDDQSKETVTAMGFCRGDVPSVACRNCLQTSASDVRQLCPNHKEAIVWNDNCTLRYSNRSILNNDESDPDYQLLNSQNASNKEEFNAALQSLLVNIRSVAAAGGPLRKLAASNTTVGFQTIYALVQCTPDLSEQQCSDCLVTIMGRINDCCSGKIGGRVMAPSCYLRFESGRFFDDPAAALPSPPPPPPLIEPKAPPPAPTPGGKSKSTVIIVVVVSVASAILIIGIIICILLRKKKKPKQRVENEVTDEMSTPESLQFDLQTVRAATDGFSDEKMLGRGGFGAVYKGMLPNGLEIAVKRLARNSGQGELEFKNEVTLLARLQHRNLVRLLGFCLEGIERLLIYEYVPNSSLDHFLFDPIKRVLLGWEKRHRIILGIARGLLYLHEDSRLRIIHRDMKASNVLLDESMNPKISDFGMARLFTQDQTRADTNRIVGTFGYMSPEYAMHGNFSLKSDVYSYGVMVLEIVSGQRNNSFSNGERTEDLITSAWRNWREGTIEDIIDPCLDSGSRSEMARCIHIGLLCVQENTTDRPTMASVGLMLSSHSTTLQVPSQPGLFMRMGVGSNTSSTQDYNNSTSTSSSQGNNQSGKKSNQLSYNDVTITEPYPR